MQRNNLKQLFVLALVALLLTCLQRSFGMDRLTALSMLETADNDRMVGQAGEISRYQILKSEWRTVSPAQNYTDPAAARKVAEVLIEKRARQFKAKYNRLPNDFEFYVLWNAPGQALRGKVSPVVAERAERYSNLCSVKDVVVAQIKP